MSQCHPCKLYTQTHKHTHTNTQWHTHTHSDTHTHTHTCTHTHKHKTVLTPCAIFQGYITTIYSRMACGYDLDDTGEQHELLYGIFHLWKYLHAKQVTPDPTCISSGVLYSIHSTYTHTYIILCCWSYPIMYTAPNYGCRYTDDITTLIVCCHIQVQYLRLVWLIQDCMRSCYKLV